MKTPMFHSAASIVALSLICLQSVLAAEANPSEFAKRQAQIESFKATTTLNSDANRIYGLGKAQCWLNFAEHEYYRNDTSAVVPEALQESDTLLSQLTASSAVTTQTRLVDGAQKIRPDLWDKAANLQSTSGFRCAAAATACAEVLLVQAAHNHAQLGWRYASPYVGMAQDMLDYAKAEELKCRPVPAPALALAAKQAPIPGAATAVLAPAPIVAPVPIAIPKIERITLQASALFKFDKYGKADLLPEGVKQMDDTIAKLKAYKKVISLRLTGHTDRLGTDSYNYPLSINRANTVKQYFIDAGVDAGKIGLEGLGASVSIKECNEKTDKALRTEKALQDCLQPNRRVEINFAAEN